MFGYAVRAVAGVLTALYLLLSTISCAVQEPPESVFGPVEGLPIGSSGGETIHILQSMPELNPGLQQAVEAYTEGAAERPAFSVQTIPGREDYRAALRTRLLSGEQVDLFQLLDCDDLDRLRPYLADLSALDWGADAAARSAEPMQAEGALWGIPATLEGVGLVANRRIFEAAGISLDGIHDYATLAEAFEELQGQIDEGLLAEGFPELVAVTELAAGDDAWLGDQMAELLLSGSFTSAAGAYYSPSAPMPDAAAAESLVKLLARYTPARGGWPALAEVSRYRMVEDGLARQRVAVILQSTEIYREVYAHSPELEGGLALLPAYFEESEQGAVYVGAPCWWAVGSDGGEETVRDCMDLLEWLYRSPEGASLLAGCGVLSPWPDTAADTGIALHNQMLGYVRQGSVQPRVAREAPAGWGREVLAPGLTDYFTSRETEWPALVQECREQWVARRQG